MAIPSFAHKANSGRVPSMPRASFNSSGCFATARGLHPSPGRAGRGLMKLLIRGTNPSLPAHHQPHPSPRRDNFPLVISQLRAKAGQHMVACAQRQGPFRFCLRKILSGNHAKGKCKQPVVLPSFAGQRPCAAEKHSGGDLNFCFFCFKTKEVASRGNERDGTHLLALTQL
jgi:hypothetical protein